MGKAAKRRRCRRQEFLRRLSMDDHERFKLEWRKRLESWSVEIQQNGRGGKIAYPPVFKIVEHALGILEECGPEALRLQHMMTENILKNECCRALSHQIGEEIYRINPRYKPRIT